MRARRVVTASPILRRVVPVSKTEKHVDSLGDRFSGLDSIVLRQAPVRMRGHWRVDHYSSPTELCRRGHVPPSIAHIRYSLDSERGVDPCIPSPPADGLPAVSRPEPRA